MCIIWVIVALIIGCLLGAVAMGFVASLREFD
jgi:hypothetical protein